MRTFSRSTISDRTIAVTGLIIGGLGLIVATLSLVVATQPELRFRATERAAEARIAAREREYREHERVCRDGQFFRDDPRYAQQVANCPGEPGAPPPAPRSRP